MSLESFSNPNGNPLHVNWPLCAFCYTYEPMHELPDEEMNPRGYAYMNCPQCNGGRLELYLDIEGAYCPIGGNHDGA